MDELNCDVCNRLFNSDELFWRDGEIETDNQFKVSEYLTGKDFDVCCDDCFYSILKPLTKA